MSQTAVADKAFLQKLLDGVAVVGNKVPHPAVIFLLMMAIVIALSLIFHLLGTSVTYQVIDPVTHKSVTTTAVVNSLLSADGSASSSPPPSETSWDSRRLASYLSPWSALAWRKRLA